MLSLEIGHFKVSETDEAAHQKKLRWEHKKHQRPNRSQAANAITNAFQSIGDIRGGTSEKVANLEIQRTNDASRVRCGSGPDQETPTARPLGTPFDFTEERRPQLIELPY